MAWVAAAAAVVSAVSSIAGGQQAKQAAKLERRQYEDEAKNARMQADQEETARRDELQRIVATQDAIRAGRGVELYSETGRAIRDTTISQVESDIGVARYNALSKARRFDLAAAQADVRGRSGFLAGIAGAGSALLSGARAFDELTREKVDPNKPKTNG